MRKLIAQIVILIFTLMLLPCIGCGTTLTGKIAFVGSYEDAPGYSFFVMNADGSNQIELAPAYFMLLTPLPRGQEWSRDGTRLVYMESSEGVPRTYWLSLIDADSRNQQKLADLSELLPLTMSWAPDSKQIIMGCFVGTEVKEINGEIQKRYYQDIYTLDVEAGEFKRLTDTLSTEEFYPQYSPDGSKIAYLAWDHDPDTWEVTSVCICVMDADGTDQNKVIILVEEPNGLVIPYWSPDSKRIAYSWYDEEVGRNSADIFIIDVASASLVNLTNTPTIGDFDPSWSPDGSRIAFCSGITGDVYHLRVMDLNGNIVSELYDLPDYPTGFPSWSPNGKRIVFTDRQNIYAIDADGKNLKTLVEGEGTYRDISYPIWLSQ